MLQSGQKQVESSHAHIQRDSWVYVMGSLLCQQSIEIKTCCYYAFDCSANITHTAAIVIDAMKLVAKPTDYLQRQTPVITTDIVMYH